MKFFILKKKIQFFFSKKFKTAMCQFIIMPRGSLQS